MINRERTLVGLPSLDDIDCEDARALRGGVNDELRNLALDVRFAIHHGRVRLHPPA